MALLAEKQGRSFQKVSQNTLRLFRLCLVQIFGFIFSSKCFEMTKDFGFISWFSKEVTLNNLEVHESYFLTFSQMLWISLPVPELSSINHSWTLLRFLEMALTQKWSVVTGCSVYCISKFSLKFQKTFIIVNYIT